MAAWYLVPKFLETPSYKVSEKDGNIEIRIYESMLLQSVKVSGSQYQSLRQGHLNNERQNIKPCSSCAVV